VRRLLLLLAVGCNSFQDPDVVLDLRVLAMDATPADQVIALDPSQPLTPDAVLGQLVDTEVCALVADPGLDRRLAWSMQACAYNTNNNNNGDNRARCAPDKATLELGAGVIEDPDLAVPAPALCATVRADAALLALLFQIQQDDDLRGLGGIDVQVLLRVGGEDADRDLDQYAAKTVRVSPKIPATRTANVAPRIDHLVAAVGDADPVTLPFGRCPEMVARYELPPDTKLRITPIEAAGAREVYTTPTLDGAGQTFTESLTYQWVAGAGGFSAGSTGGPRDPFGNPAPLFTDFRSPAREDLTGPTDVPLWIIQRDERLGVRWYETCVRVVP
jgi:hypothetical protein